MEKTVIQEPFAIECSITADILKAKNSSFTSTDLRTFTKLARKIADNIVNQAYDAHNNQIVACCDFLIQEIEE